MHEPDAVTLAGGVTHTVVDIGDRRIHVETAGKLCVVSSVDQQRDNHLPETLRKYLQDRGKRTAAAVVFRMTLRDRIESRRRHELPNATADECESGDTAFFGVARSSSAIEDADASREDSRKGVLVCVQEMRKWR